MALCPASPTASALGFPTPSMSARRVQLRAKLHHQGRVRRQSRRSCSRTSIFASMAANHRRNYCKCSTSCTRRRSMRPTKLTIEGFTSFRQRTDIDFSELDLFAITGPTGSGKTSIIDAITYALYGQTARLGAKGLGELITQGAPRLSVMLEFESGGKRYRIARVLKRSGPASVRLDVVESDGDHAFDGGAREIATQITKIVGLDFDAFTKAVLLPQGRFDEFLRGDSAERRKILEVLLNLGMYREMM